MTKADEARPPFVPVAGECNKIQMSICNYQKSDMNYQCGGGDEWFNRVCCCAVEATEPPVTRAPYNGECVKNKRPDCDYYDKKYNFNYNCPTSGDEWWFREECCEYCQGTAPTERPVVTTVAPTCKNSYPDSQCMQYHSYPDYECTDKTVNGRFMLKHCCVTCKSAKPSQCLNQESKATCDKYRRDPNYDCAKDTYEGRWMKKYCCAYCAGATAVATVAPPKTQCPSRNEADDHVCKGYHEMPEENGFICGSSDSYNSRWFNKNCCTFCEKLNGGGKRGGGGNEVSRAAERDRDAKRARITAEKSCKGTQGSRAECRRYYMEDGRRCDQSDPWNKWYSQICCRFCSF